MTRVLITSALPCVNGDFGVTRFVADVNKDLAGIFGNRIVSFAHRALDGRILDGRAPGDAEQQLARVLEQAGPMAHSRHRWMAAPARRSQGSARWPRKSLLREPTI